MNTNIYEDFQICNSVPLRGRRGRNNSIISYFEIFNTPVSSKFLGKKIKLRFTTSNCYLSSINTLFQKEKTKKITKGQEYRTKAKEKG